MPYINNIQRLALLLFFFSINYEMLVPSSAIDLSVSRITGFLYFISLIPDFKFFFRTDRIKSILILVWIFFGLLTLVSLINLNEVSKEFFNMTIFQNILLFWFLINHARKDYLILEKGMLTFALSTVLMALLYIANIGVEYVGGRLSMFKENENAVGINMSIGISILIVNVIQNKLKLGGFRYLLLIPLPLMMNFVLATGSRLAFLSMLLSIIAIMVLVKTNEKITKIIFLFSGMALLVLLGVWLLQHEILRDRLFRTVEEGDLAHRDEIWYKLIPLIKEHPIFGVGNTGYSAYSLYTFGLLRSPHNVIIEVLCLTGISGLIIYLTFLFKVLSKGYKSYVSNGTLLPVLLAIPVIGAILSGQILTRKIGWVIFAYIVGSTAIKTTTLIKKINIQRFSDEYTLRN